jgi:hypothetical protein
MHSIHSELAPPAAGCKLSRPLVAAGLALLLAGAGFALGTQRSSAAETDPCGLPAGAQIRIWILVTRTSSCGACSHAAI